MYHHEIVILVQILQKLFHAAHRSPQQTHEQNSHPRPHNSTANESSCCCCRLWSCSSQSQPQGDRWNAEVSADFHGGAGYPNTNTSIKSRAYRQTTEQPSGPWNSLGHRRVHSAPNIMEGMNTKPSSSGSSRWRSSALPWLSSDAISPSLREHAIPEGRRFEVSKRAWVVLMIVVH